ncbi:hypothetical protein PAXINDRAFT_158572, partial [Paxillus involutus ATCC 200175]
GRGRGWQGMATGTRRGERGRMGGLQQADYGVARWSFADRGRGSRGVVFGIFDAAIEANRVCQVSSGGGGEVEEGTDSISGELRGFLSAPFKYQTHPVLHSQR